MQAHSRWLHAIRKGVFTEKKTWRKRIIMKIRNCFCKYAIEVTRLRKYPIDPKAYLGRCSIKVVLAQYKGSSQIYTDFL